MAFAQRWVNEDWHKRDHHGNTDLHNVIIRLKQKLHDIETGQYSRLLHIPEVETVKLMAQKVTRNLKNKSGQLALHILLSSDLLPTPSLPLHVVAAVANKSNVNIREKESGRTSLHMAIEADRSDIAELLISYGANIMVKDASNKTPLSLACACGKLALLKLMITGSGTRLHWYSIHIQIPNLLHVALAENHPDTWEIVKYLLKTGASVNSLQQNQTPLELYCEKKFHRAHLAVDEMDILVPTNMGGSSYLTTLINTLLWVRPSGDMLSMLCCLLRYSRPFSLPSVQFRWAEQFVHPATLYLGTSKRLQLPTMSHVWMVTKVCVLYGYHNDGMVGKVGLI